MPNYIRTVSGAKFHVPEPRLEDIFLIDIARGLAIAPRWGAQSRFRYPVLAHALYVAEMLPDLYKFDGLMHDASEAYMCDMPAPIKALMPQYKKIENSIMDRISEKFDFDWPVPDIVKRADAVALYEERKALFDWPVEDDVPEIKNRGDLNVPTKWDFSVWETQPTRILASTFITAFHTYYELSREV
jgi:uncharacterized protein